MLETHCFWQWLFCLLLFPRSLLIRVCCESLLFWPNVVKHLCVCVHPPALSLSRPKLPPWLSISSHPSCPPFRSIFSALSLAPENEILVRLCHIIECLRFIYKICISLHYVVDLLPSHNM